MKIAERVWQFAEPVVQQHGCSLWDVEYVREGSDWYLSISRALDPILDEEDPIETSYTFEVCSAGLERALKRPSDFAQFMGADVLVKLYQPKNGTKEIAGVLSGYHDGDVSVTVNQQEMTFTKAEVALVRLRVDF